MTRFTINKVVKFFREVVQCVSVYFFDQTGRILIDKYKAREEQLTLNAKSVGSMVCVVTNGHIEQITDANLKRSVAATDELHLFNLGQMLEEVEHEYFDCPLKLALSFDMDGNTDYVEMDGDRVKDSKAPVIVF